jgi:hypothetical protein
VRLTKLVKETIQFSVFRIWLVWTQFACDWSASGRLLPIVLDGRLAFATDSPFAEIGAANALLGMEEGTVPILTR